MSIGSRISSTLRDAFSYAVHQENSSDYTRKSVVIDALIEKSAPFLDTSAAGYETRLRKVLAETRTKQLDVLLEKNVAIGLDSRFDTQRREAANDRLLEGAYYPASEGKPAILTLWDNGLDVKASIITPSGATQAANFVENLAVILKAGEPKETLYASRLTTVDAAGGIGMVAIITTTEWETRAQLRETASKTAAVTQPPAKPVAPKPN
ncbi:MAG: hypothetical protein PSY14_08680 [bacterium]|nr:hypothetical protein [bacterium]